MYKCKTNVCTVVLVCVCETYVHDAVLVGVEEQPIVEERQLGVGGGHVRLQAHRRERFKNVRGQQCQEGHPSQSSYRACGEQPANDGPAGQDVGAQHLIGRVHHAADVANEVAAQ